MFDTIGGIGANHLFFLTNYVPTAPIRVAILPNIISQIIPPPIIFATRQPTNNPGTAAGV